MAILPIVTYPDPVLERTCRSVERVDRRLIDLAESMAETMYAAPGVGLAAPQVGQNLNLIVVDAGPEESRGTPLILINPRIVEAGGEEVAEEGCLSLPGHYAQVRRHARVVVEALDREGQPVCIHGDGLLSRCLQHEIDHLQGRLVLDHISPLKRAMYRKKRIKELRRKA